MDIAIHTNFGLDHQVEYANYFAEGFRKLGFDPTITGNIDRPADVHVIQGPYYAKNRWLGHPHVILLDREYYHPEFSDHPRMMDWVSLGWMRPDGGRRFHVGEGRASPKVKPKKTGNRHLFLADYGGPIEEVGTVRLHPAQGRRIQTLQEDLETHDIAIGYCTTALVTAALEGLEVICKDKRNIMSEPNWLDLLPYADWHWSEIQNGQALEHLWRYHWSQNPPKSH